MVLPCDIGPNLATVEHTIILVTGSLSLFCSLLTILTTIFEYRKLYDTPGSRMVAKALGTLGFTASTDLGTAIVYLSSLPPYYTSHESEFCKPQAYLVAFFFNSSVWLSVCLSLQIHKMLRFMPAVEVNPISLHVEEMESVTPPADKSAASRSRGVPAEPSTPLLSSGESNCILRGLRYVVYSIEDSYDKWWGPPIISIVICAILAFIPFADDAYGPSGESWCYIKCNNDHLSLWLIFGGYIWVIAGFIITVIMLVLIYSLQASAVSRKYSIFLVAYLFCWLFPTLQRLLSLTDLPDKLHFWLSILHTTSINLQGTINFIAIMVIFYWRSGRSEYAGLDQDEAV